VFAVGASLAIGMSMAEALLKFNLGSLKGIALVLFMLALGSLLFYLLASFGISKPSSLAWAFILAFGAMQSISSRLTAWVQETFPILNLLFLLAVVFVTVKGIAFLGAGTSISRAAERLMGKGSEYVKSIPLKEEKQEKKGLKSEGKDIRKGRQISKNMAERLQEVKDFIKEYGHTEKGRKAIADQLKELSKDEKKLLNKLRHIEYLEEKIESLDIIATRKLKDEYGKVPAEDRKRIAEEMKAEQEKFGLCKRLDGLEYNIKLSVSRFNIMIRNAVENLNKQRILEALQCIDKAMDQSIIIDRIFQEMERIQDFLSGLTKREYKAMKEEKKAA